MKTAETINHVCSDLGVTKAELARKIGVLPSSLYRKLARESMTLEELQECLAVLGVNIEFELQYPDGNTRSSQANHELLLEKLDLMERELEAARKAVEFHKKAMRDIRTELNSAVGYAELAGRHGAQEEDYLAKLQVVLSNIESTITCSLGEETPEKPEEASEPMEDLTGKRVLLVDDNELNREVLREVLEGHGLLVEEAENGSSAVAAVKEHDPGHYHFILMDIEMPVMDGYEATIRIRKLPNRIRANVPIIALTSNAVPENRERAAAVGMDDFLVKPANSARLIQTLARFM